MTIEALNLFSDFKAKWQTLCFTLKTRAPPPEGKKLLHLKWALHEEKYDLKKYMLQSAHDIRMV
jgi:hypothetical protein